MANAVAATASAGGASAMLVDVVNWLASGHPVPMPNDTAVAIVVLAGIAIHGVAVLVHAFYVDLIAPSKEGMPSADQKPIS